MTFGFKKIAMKKMEPSRASSFVPLPAELRKDMYACGIFHFFGDIRRSLPKGGRRWIKRYRHRVVKLFSRVVPLILVTFKRVVAVVAVIALLVSLLGVTPSTLAKFSDQEPAADNALITASLDIESSVGEWVPAGSNISLAPGYPTTNNIQIQNIGSLGFNYSIETATATGDLCTNLNLLALLDNTQAYTGPLLDFNEGPFLFVDPEEWSLTFSLNSSEQVWTSKTCSIKIAVKAWQEEAPGYSADYFSDLAEIDLEVQSGTWQDVLPPEVSAGDIVINEIMWMGSKSDADVASSDDEWVELRNMTANAIDVSGWELTNIAASNGSLILPEGSIVPANSYFIIANYDRATSLIDVDVDWVTSSLSLHNRYNTNGKLELKNGEAIIDSTPIPVNSSWPKGKNETNKKWSMERNLIPGDGVANTSWHTCDPTLMTPEQLSLMKSFWDSNAQIKNCGTPLHANLSKNDPTADDYDPRLVISQLPKVLPEDLDETIETLPELPFVEYINEIVQDNINEIITEESAVTDTSETVTEEGSSEPAAEEGVIEGSDESAPVEELAPVDESTDSPETTQEVLPETTEPVVEPVVEDPSEPAAEEEPVVEPETNNEATIPDAPEVILPEIKELNPVDTQPEITQNTEQPTEVVAPALTTPTSE